MGFFSRLANLVRGTFSHWMKGREQKNPAAVYESAIRARLEQYQDLRESAAGVLYMRSKLAGEVELKSSALRTLNRQIEVAVERDEDDVALVLIQRRTGLQADVDRVTKELRQLNSEAETAKKNLVSFQADVARLRDEKIRAMARLQNAKARLRLQETIKGLAPDADIQALEEVRAHVDKMVAEVQISREVNDADLEQRLESIREAEERSAARAELDELKRARKPSVVTIEKKDEKPGEVLFPSTEQAVEEAPVSA